MAQHPLPLSPEFRDHLLGIVNVPERELDKVVADLLDHWSETVEGFIMRRHRELQRAGIPHRIAYGQIAADLKSRRFRASALSERQIRRIIYG